jgi:hypothetical protein
LVEPFTARILAPPDTAQPRCFGGLVARIVARIASSAVNPF